MVRTRALPSLLFLLVLLVAGATLARADIPADPVRPVDPVSRAAEDAGVSTWVIAGGGAVVLVGLGVVLLRRRKEGDAA